MDIFKDNVNDEYDYELCRYYAIYKFEELNERKNTDILHTYFTCALGTENMQFVSNEILTKIIPTIVLIL